MRTLREPAYAKVNLTLDVLGKREDGYHDLESIMQTVSLWDDILIETGTGLPWEIVCQRQDIPKDERNLACKAARVFCEKTSWDPGGLRITIGKQIPSEAGLGGGSSDGAAVLRALNRCLEKPLSMTELADMGARVGSDVPFCVVGGTAFCQGRGERLTPMETGSKLTYVLCKPDLAFSTPKLFAKLDSTLITRRPDQKGMASALMQGDGAAVGRLLCNVFEEAVLQEYEAISRIKQLLLTHGALGAQMTGSGSVVFGIFANREWGRIGYHAVKKEFPNTYFAQTV